MPRITKSQLENENSKLQTRIQEANNHLLIIKKEFFGDNYYNFNIQNVLNEIRSLKSELKIVNEKLYHRENLAQAENRQMFYLLRCALKDPTLLSERVGIAKRSDTLNTADFNPKFLP